MIRHNPSIIEFYICTWSSCENQKNTYTTRASFYFWLSHSPHQQYSTNSSSSSTASSSSSSSFCHIRSMAATCCFSPCVPTQKSGPAIRPFSRVLRLKHCQVSVKIKSSTLKIRCSLREEVSIFFFALIFLFPVTEARILTAQLLFFTEDDPENQHQSPTFFFFSKTKWGEMGFVQQTFLVNIWLYFFFLFLLQVFEDRSNGIICYKDDRGEIICEGFDEGPRYYHQQNPRTGCQPR